MTHQKKPLLNTPLLFGGVCGLCLGVVVSLSYILWTYSVDGENGGETQSGNVTLSMDADPAQTAAVQNSELKGGTQPTESSQKIRLASNVINAIRQAEIQYNNVGLRALDWIVKNIDEPTLQDALFSVILNRSVRSVGFEESINQFLGLEHHKSDRRILKKLVEIGAQDSPKETLSHLMQIDSPNLRDFTQRVLALHWLEQNPVEVRESINLFDESVRVFVDTETKFAIARSNPEIAVEEILPGIRGSFTETGYFREIAQQLARKDLKVAMNFVDEYLTSDIDSNLDFRPRRMIVLSDILRIVASDNPDAAMREALNISLWHESIGPEVAVIGQVATTDLQKALTLLPQTREGNSRVIATTIVGKACIQNQRYGEALKLGEEFSHDDREYYFVETLRTWTEVSAKGLFEALPSLPEDLKSTAAYFLMISNYVVPVLEQTQVDSLSDLLDEADQIRFAEDSSLLRALRSSVDSLPSEKLVDYVYGRYDDRLLLEMLGRE